MALIGKLFRITEHEAELVKDTAVAFGCSQNVALRLLIRRGYDWKPPGDRGTYPAPAGWTDPPTDGKLPDIPGAATTPDVPAGQMTMEEDE